MAFRAVTICTGRPPSLSKMQQLSLADVEADSSFNFKYIEGRIVKMWPLHSAAKNKRMKTMLEEGEEAAASDATSSRRIIVFLTGPFAEEFLLFSVGDMVIISEALIEKSPSYAQDFIHPCSILVEKTRSRPSVWVIPAKENTQTARSARQNAASSLGTRTAPTAAGGPSASAQRQAPAAGDGATNAGKNGRGLDLDVGPSTSGASTDPGTSRRRAASPSRDTPWSNSAISTSGHPMNAWSVPDANLSPTKRSYTYVALKDIKEAPQVNVFGVVKFFKPPYKTQGPDYCMSVTLIDPTLGLDHNGLRCQLFRDDINALPQVHAVGNIVRFHRLKITLFNGVIQGQKGNGFHCLAFDGAVGASMDPRSSSPNYTLTDDDKQRVQDLRLWSSRRPGLALADRSCTLSKMYAGQYLDLTCQVVSVAVLPAHRCAVVRVWDGTQYKKRVREMDTSDSVDNRCDDELVRKSGALAFDVAMYDNHLETGAKLKPGQFIKIFNLHIAKWQQPGKPMVELVLHQGTSHGRGVVVLQEWEQSVKNMIKCMEDIVQNPPSTSAAANQDQAGSSSANQLIDGTGRDLQSTNGDAAGTPSRCMQRSASVILDHFHQRTSHIADVLGSDAPNKFRLRAKVVDYCPQDILDVIHLYCSKCRFRCRVPPSKKPKRSEKAGTPKKGGTSMRDSPRKEADRGNKYNLRSATSKEPEAKKPEMAQGGRTRTQRESPRKRVGNKSPGRSQRSKSKTTEGSSAEESSPGRSGVLRKRPAALGVSGDEGPTGSNPRKNRRGTSKMAARADQGRCAPPAREDGGIEVVDSSHPTTSEVSMEEPGKRLTKTDVYRRTITAEVLSSSEEGEAEEAESGGHLRRRRIRVEVDSLTPREALLMVRLGMRLIHHADVPTSDGHLTIQGANQQSPDGQVFYLCPRCSTADDTQAVPIPDDAPLLKYTYCLKLVLDDGTGRIEVILNRQNAQTFFQGIRATNLHTSPESREKLEEAMATLCPYPIGSGFDSQPGDEAQSVHDLNCHPWLDCCIMSYPDNLGGTEIIKYHMFDTTIALDVE